MITSSTRQGLLVLFIFLLMFFNAWLQWMSIFEYLLLVSLAAVVTKLTDIEEAIKKR